MFLPEAVCCCLQPGSFCMNSYHGTYISVWCMQKKTEISLHNLVDNTTTNCAGIFLFFIYHTTCVCVCVQGSTKDVFQFTTFCVQFASYVGLTLLPEPRSWKHSLHSASQRNCECTPPILLQIVTSTV